MPANDTRAEELAEVYRQDLVERIGRIIPQDGGREVLPGLHLFRASAPTELYHSIWEPAFCVIAQGAKEVLVGSRRYRYDPHHYLIATLELPAASHVVEATAEAPYLSLRLPLDPRTISAVMVEAGYLPAQEGAGASAFDVSPLGLPLLEAVLRLVRLVEVPEEAPVLMPLITREIIFRLLQGAQGVRLRHLVMLNGQYHRMARAIDLIRARFDRPLEIPELADELGMSTSALYQHFKAATGMSPLQFQKQLRLQEARRLMLMEGLDATTAGYRVGYNDAAHFSRDYKRLFSAPPMRDVERMRRRLATASR
ncbi:MAG: AraC family transcriptional regulator [Rhodothermaceae bacterium]|nr:MAG: AraC family transcriptional regulator [Rhodothermaceae bacterium]